MPISRFIKEWSNMTIRQIVKKWGRSKPIGIIADQVQGLPKWYPESAGKKCEQAVAHLRAAMALIQEIEASPLLPKYHNPHGLKAFAPDDEKE